MSAIASSTFLTFFAPKSLMARPRNTFGGHAVAVIVTLAFSPLIDDPILPSLLDNNVATDLLAAVEVGLTMLLMAVTNTEHAPAAGTALGLSLQAWDVEAAISVLAIAAFLVGVQTLGRGRLENLL